MHQSPSAVNYGPLPTLLGLLTLVTGLVDAVTYLKFGHVFVANMTGNVVFLGFGLAGASDIWIGGSLLALGAFLAGALAGGFLNGLYKDHRGRLVVASSLVKVALLLGATAAAWFGATGLVIIPLLGLTMGLQNAVARKLAIPDVTTTVLTMTLTGIAADSSLAGGSNPRFVRRVLAVLTMFAGGFAGAAIVLNVGIAPALGAATTVVAIVSVATFALGRGNPDWVRG